MYTIHFFTDPYKDELIYSAISRYHFYTGNIDFKDTIEECFGKRTIISSLEIGSPIDVLAKNIGGSYTSDSLVKKHTIFPYYIPFLPMKRREEIIKEIKYGDCSGIYHKIGIIAGSVCRREGIYYCPICATNEIQMKGEAYIHREHQLQGIYLCVHHGELLRKYKTIKTDVSRLEFIRFEKNLLDLSNKPKDIKHYEKMLKLSSDAYYLLEKDLMSIDRKIVLKKYKSILCEKGLTTSGNRIKQRELYDEFINFYGLEFLKIMGSNIDKDDEYNWLRVITRNSKRTVHPVRHLLMINFLSGNINEFFSDIKRNYKPFGKGPWPCLNKISDHYKMDVVNNLKITDDYKTRLPVGTFSCNCGFVYSRKGPDKLIDDRYKIGRIKNFGIVWEDKLKAYSKEKKYGLRELARIMNCDPKTILKFDSILGTNMFQNNKGNIKDKEPAVETDKLSDYKNSILINMESNTAATRTEIRSMCKKEYIFIYRKDKKWLYDKLPIATKRTNYQPLVDWNKRDSELLIVLKNKYKELMVSDELIRITKSNIGRGLGILTTLEKNIEKLPNTEKYLNKVIETVEEFQIRRCKRIINNKVANGEPIRTWEIQRIAGIRSKAFEKIKDIVLACIN
ncbi:TnsD family Tn7-like transposition protein [Clostridium estertheticum]|uniref:TnsD family Tn7-like transposition protein n=1 Tax=Clostridium estertheticum TaxID=238834 RepID=UPI001C6DE760|nr:TnsD family Tn7-like transposition protein [Clostridium estertheticum]MBW9150995.1 TnsD family transposase [Clostridium estertheticum]WLC84294.1 TnsD family transposase [Clostridium estertheticum]